MKKTCAGVQYGEYSLVSSPYKPGRTIYGTKANSADQDRTPHDAASDLGLHCLPFRNFNYK